MFVKRRSIIDNSINYYFESFPLQLSIVIISICSCIIYITSTYGYPMLDSIPGITFEIFFLCVFLFDFMMSLIHSKVNRLSYVFSWKGVTDILSIAPILSLIPYLQKPLLFPSSWLAFLRFFRCLHICNLFNKKESRELLAFDNVLAFEVSETLLLITRLLVNITVFIFISAGLVFALSSYEKNAYRSQWVKRASLTWFNSLYYVITTVTTLNSDFAAVIWQSRLLNLFIIIIGFSIIPIQIALLAESLLFKQKYLGSFKKRKNTEHVIVCGIVDYETLNRIITELFHPTHISNEIRQNLVLVVLSPSKPSSHVSQLLKLQKLKSRLQFFIGSPKSIFDLSRVAAESSFAIYMIGDICTTSLRFEEDSVFLNAISVQKYLQRHKAKQRSQSRRSYSQYIRNGEIERPVTLAKLTGSGKSKAVLQSIGINTVLANQAFKYKLLAFSTVFPGLLAIFLNLNRARSMSQRKMAQLNFNDQLVWQKSYFEGTRYSIQQISSRSFNRQLASMFFADACTSVYKVSLGKCVLIAAKYNGSVVINPYKHVLISECENIFVIGTSFEEIYKYVNRDTHHDEPSRQTNLQSNALNPPAIRISKVMKRSRSSANDITNIDESPSMSLRKLKFIESINSTIIDLEPSKIKSEIDLKGHIVLIVTSQPFLSHTDILLPLIFFIRAVRHLSNDDILIFSDRAEELINGMRDFHSDDTPNLLTNLHFVNGLQRNPDHLSLCCIQKARCIVLIRAPIASEVTEEGDDPTASLFLSVDRQTIITSLNIHTLLQKSAKEEVGEEDEIIIPPFTIAELVHEANTNFLRNNDTSTMEGEDDPFALQEFDWPLLSAGSVFSSSLMDAFMVQNIFHSDILELWENIFNAVPKRMISSTSGTDVEKKKIIFAPDIINLREHEKKDDDTDSVNEKLTSDPDIKNWHEDLDTEREFLLKEEALLNQLNQRHTIDKVDVPDDYYGKTFGEMFLYYLQDYNCISIALYRWSLSDSQSDSQLPHIVCAPSYDTILQQRDEVFILHPIDSSD